MYLFVEGCKSNTVINTDNVITWLIDECPPGSEEAKIGKFRIIAETSNKRLIIMCTDSQEQGKLVLEHIITHILAGVGSRTLKQIVCDLKDSK